MTAQRRLLLFSVLSPPLCGLLVAGLVMAAWLIVGRPVPAKGARWFKIEALSEAHFSGSPDKPVFILVVGNDGRAGVGGERGDALHLIGVNPQQGAATIIDIPRDTAVPIPGHGTDKINAAFAYGGLKLQAQAIGQLVGIDIQFGITTNFDGFTAMVDEIGGVLVDVPSRMNDSFSGSDFQPGPQKLDGPSSLAFNRDRHTFPTGDIKRTENQGLFIVSALGTIQRQTPGAGGTLHLLAILARHAELENLDLPTLYRLGRLGLTIDPGKIRNAVLPTGSGQGTNLSVTPAAQELFADFRDDGVLEST
jgi:LCP family protein required for cell wall assembly